MIERLGGDGYVSRPKRMNASSDPATAAIQERATSRQRTLKRGPSPAVTTGYGVPAGSGVRFADCYRGGQPTLITSPSGNRALMSSSPPSAST